MGQRTLVLLLLLFIQFSAITADTDPMNYGALVSLKNMFLDTPLNWKGSDPCGKGWDGIGCSKSSVTTIRLSNMGLIGQLSEDIKFLSELDTLDLSYNQGLEGPLPRSIGSLNSLTSLVLVGCSFSGPIPDTIGSLRQLRFLSLNSNGFSGQIPHSIGNLSNLLWLDLADNQFEGPLPVSNATSPGLDMLFQAQHFHLGRNKLSGSIPTQLFSTKMVLIHVLLEGNQLTGSIPSTLGLVKSLEVVRLDRNKFNGDVPLNLNNLTNVSQLFLSNNRLTGPVPDLTGMNLSYVDLSNNSFDASEAPLWFSTFNFLTTLKMEKTGLQGDIPAALFNLPCLQTVILRNNKLNGSLDLGTTQSSQLKLVDLKSNEITSFPSEDEKFNFTLILAANPICNEKGATDPGPMCAVSEPPKSSNSTQEISCPSVLCGSTQTLSPRCKCADPYTGTLIFRAPSFSDFGKKYYTSLESFLMSCFNHSQLPVDSVRLENPRTDSSDCLELKLEIFPSGSDSFNRTDISGIGSMFSQLPLRPPTIFGPLDFIVDYDQEYGEKPTQSRMSSSIGIKIGAAVGGFILLLVLLLAGTYVLRQKMRAGAIDHSHPRGNGSAPNLKAVRWFSLQELKKYTNNFSETNELGSGGYGKVYQGSLPTGQQIAIKRAKKESMQGERELKTEIELLSRVHHKNLVILVGFCFEKDEQMLVYEYVPNGSLRDSLSGKSGIRLDWMKRLQVALGAARGLAYLHEFANPRIIHRDIKSNNILLDASLSAKVADFGLSRTIGDSEDSQVITQVKGTMGYLDPEYYTTLQLTDKSDVYSFGVLMLELITAKRPIVRGKYIVKQMQETMDKTKELYNLGEFLDPVIGLGTTMKGLEKFVDLAMSCVKEEGSGRPTMSEVVKDIESIIQLVGSGRPTMSEVVKDIESIIQLAGPNPNAEPVSTSLGHEGSSHPYNYEHSDSNVTSQLPQKKMLKMVFVG